MKEGRCLHGWLLLLVFLLPAGMPWAEMSEERQALWLLVETDTLTLKVMRGTETVQVYPGLAIGRFGTTATKRTLDGMTPLGEFRITRIADRTAFHRFYGLDYPNLSHARAGLEAGLITPAEFSRIRAALRRGETPPQQTAHGGFIGLQGRGVGDPDVHADFNWTNGCVALTNEQMDDLAQWVYEGMRVIIR